MTIGVYGIFDALTNQCYYIGQSVNIEGRWQNHKNSLLNATHSQKRFAELFASKLELDLERLRFEVLTSIDTRDHRLLNEAEVRFFEHHKPLFFGQKPSLGNNYLIATEASLREAGRKIGENAKKAMIASVKVDGKWIYRKRCLQCSTEFESKGPTAAYCSPACKTASTQVDRICEDCGKKFQAKSERTRWCSYCKYRQKTWVITCQVCGTSIESKHPEGKYCSTKCKQEVIREKKRLAWTPSVLNCMCCDLEVLRQSPSQKFCSESCKSIYKGIMCKSCALPLLNRGRKLCHTCVKPLHERVDPVELKKLYVELGASKARAKLGVPKTVFYRALHHFGILS